VDVIVTDYEITRMVYDNYLMDAKFPNNPLRFISEFRPPPKNKYSYKVTARLRRLQERRKGI